MKKHFFPYCFAAFKTGILLIDKQALLPEVLMMRLMNHRVEKDSLCGKKLRMERLPTKKGITGRNNLVESKKVAAAATTFLIFLFAKNYSTITPVASIRNSDFGSVTAAIWSAEAPSSSR